MPRHEEQRVLPYSRDFIFDIIADVAKYPEFLPWCEATRIYQQKPDGFMADVVIGFKMFRESWTSEIKLDRPERVTATYIKGPMKHLTNLWVLTPHAEGTLVDFVIDFEFKNQLLQKVLSPFFEETTHKMMMAFDKRAAALSEGLNDQT